MPFSYLRNRRHSAQCASFFIAVLMIHVIVIQAVWSHPVNTLAHRENISFLESFTVQTEDATQTKDANSVETNIQDRFPETDKKETTPFIPSISTETSVVTRHAVTPRLEPEHIKTSQDPIAKQRTNTANQTNSINNKTDDLQNSITPPQARTSVQSNPPPPYPRQSRRLGEQGKVVLAAEIATNGKALQALVNISSGYPRLDRAALESVLKWQFIPGKKAGVPQKMWVNIPINFVLE